MTTSESLDSIRDVVQVQADWNKNAFTDDGSVSDVRIKQEVEESVNDAPSSPSPTATLSMIDTAGGQQQTDTSNVKEGDDTVVVKVEWTYEKDEYNESNVEDGRDNRPDVQIMQLTEEMSNEQIVEVQESMDSDVVSVTVVTDEYVPSSETSESAVDITSDNTTAIVSDVAMATPDVSSTDSMQVAITEPSNSVLGANAADEMETSTDVDCTVSMATDNASFVKNVKESVGVVQSITSDEISLENQNLESNIFVTNLTAENVNNNSVPASDTVTMVTDSGAEPETVSVVIDNVMSTTAAPLVVPGVIETINETSTLDDLPVTGEITTSSDGDVTSVSNDVKPEIVTMVIVNNGDNDNNGQQEFTEQKVVSVKPNEEEIEEVQEEYQSPEALLTSKKAMLAYEFSDDVPEEQTSQLPLKKSKGAEGHLSLRTIKVFPTHVTCGNNVRARIKRRTRQKKGLRKFIFDNQKSLPNELTKLQMSDTHDIVTALDLAPPTKKLMMLPSDVVQLLCLPGRRISSETLSEMYTRNLITNTYVDDDTEGNTIYVLDREIQDRKEKEKEEPSPKTKKLITGRPEGLSVQVIDLQLKDTSDLVSALNLAPPTKQLMHWKETHDVKNLLSHPGRGVNSRTFSKLFTKNMVTKFDVVEDEEEKEENLELEPLDLAEFENGEPENSADTTTNTVNDTNGSVTS